MDRFRLLDHTADIALESWGDSPGEALAAMCRGVAAQLAAPGGVRPAERREVAAEGVDLTDTVVSLLGEFLYLLQVERWLPAEVAVSEYGEKRIALKLRGERYDPRRHDLRGEVKAATFHDFAFAPDDAGTWRLRVVFDV